jgi:hypothetical protein
VRSAQARGPSLVEIAADPSKIERLEALQAAALGAAFNGLVTSCALRVAFLAGPAPVATPDQDTISPKNAAAMLGISESTLLQESLPGRRYTELRVNVGARRVRFSGERIRAFLSVRLPPCPASRATSMSLPRWRIGR